MTDVYWHLPNRLSFGIALLINVKVSSDGCNVTFDNTGELVSNSVIVYGFAPPEIRKPTG